jgi:hypothetical protein
VVLDAPAPTVPASPRTRKWTDQVAESQAGEARSTMRTTAIDRPRFQEVTNRHPLLHETCRCR